MKNEIEKGKWSIGDVKVDKHGNSWRVGGLNAKGEPKWVKADKASKKAPDAAPAAPVAAKKEGTEAAVAKPQATPAPTPSTKKGTAYDAPKPKVQYKIVKPEDGVEIRVPETWKTDDPKHPGRKVDQHRSAYRKLYADKTKKSDDEVIKMVNRTKGTKEIRQIAYEEAMARGIPENKLNVSGTLQDWWDSEKLKKELYSPSKKEDVAEEDRESYDSSVLGDFDVEKFLAEEFDDGRDDGWKDPNNKTIQREFNQLKNASARRRYDAFVDYAKRLDPMYERPAEVMNTLARAIGNFVTSKGGSPVMV